MPRGVYQTIKKQIGEDLGKIPVVLINTELIELSLRLLEAYPLKTLDSLYLAGALGIQLALKEQVLFIAADRQLLQVAQAEGLRALNPETGL